MFRPQDNKNTDFPISWDLKNITYSSLLPSYRLDSYTVFHLNQKPNRNKISHTLFRYLRF